MAQYSDEVTVHHNSDTVDCIEGKQCFGYRFLDSFVHCDKIHRCFNPIINGFLLMTQIPLKNVDMVKCSWELNIFKNLLTLNAALMAKRLKFKMMLAKKSNQHKKALI